MKFNLNRHRAHSFVLVMISVMGLVIAYLDQNIIPLLVALFAVIYLAARSIKEIQPSSSVFLGRLSFATLVLMFGIGTFNYLVNPFSLYSPHLFEPIGLTTRNLKMGIYTASPVPEIAIFGNSRSFTIDTIQLTKLWHKSALNLSVAAGTTQDDLALLNFMMEQHEGKLPTLLIIGLSPERFATFHLGLSEPNSQLSNYLEDKSQISNFQLSIDRWTLLFSREQTEASGRIIQAELSGGIPVAKEYFDNAGVLRNQSKQPTSDDFDPEVLEKSGWTSMFRESVVPNMEEAGMARFRQILEIAKSHNMLVIGYAPPIHPSFKTFLDTHTDFERVRKRINEQINTLTKSYDFYFADFMDDGYFSDGQTMYHDTMHPTLATTAIMMQMLYDQYHSYTKSS